MVDRTPLEQAKFERRLWDGKLRVKSNGKPMSTQVAAKLRAPVEEVRLRSNLLRMGLANGVAELWGHVADGTMSMAEAVKQARAIKEARAVGLPKDRTNGEPKKKEALKGGAPLNGKGLNGKSLKGEGFLSRIDALESEIKKLRQDVQAQAAPKPPAKSRRQKVPSFGKGQVAEVLTRVRAKLYQELEQHEFLNAELHDLSEATRVFLVNFDEELQSYARRLKRLRSKPVDMIDKLPWAFKVLGIPFKVDFEFEEVKVVYRRLAFETHPDRTGSKQPPEVYLRINQAFEIIEAAAERRSNA